MGIIYSMKKVNLNTKAYFTKCLILAISNGNIFQCITCFLALFRKSIECNLTFFEYFWILDFNVAS